MNLFNPTFAVVMGGLAIGRVSYDRWLRFVWPLLVIIMIIIVGALSVGTMVRAPRTLRRRRSAPAAAPSTAAETMAREHDVQFASETASSRGRYVFPDSSSSRGIPVHVWIKWQNARAGGQPALRSQGREV